MFSSGSVNRAYCNPQCPLITPRTTLQHSRSRQVLAAAKSKGGQYRQQQQQQIDHIIAPIDPLGSIQPGGEAFLPSPGARSGSSSSNSSRSSNSKSRRDGRRGSLVKQRVAPRRYRLRASFDSPLELHIRPSDPGFEGRLTSEINSVYGPRRLTSIISAFSEHFTTSHAADALALLAGMVTGRQGYSSSSSSGSGSSSNSGSGLSPDNDELDITYRAPAVKVACVFEAKVTQASLKDCARVTYSLARLQLHLPRLLSAVEAHTSSSSSSGRGGGQLLQQVSLLSGAAAAGNSNSNNNSSSSSSTTTPQVLAGLAVGFAHWGYRPDDAWIKQLCMAAFGGLSGAAGAQDLANLLFSLACWGTSVSQPFLQRALTAFRGHWGRGGGGGGGGAPGCTPAALIRFTYALTQLPACQDLPPKLLQAQPEGAPVYLHHTAYRQQQQLRVLGGVMGLNLGEAAAAVAARTGVMGAEQAMAADGLADDSIEQQQQQQHEQQLHGPGNNPTNSSSSNSRQRSSSRSSTSAAVATYRLPSFNWLTAYLAECRRQIDRFKPAELSTLLWCMAALNHTPDLIFMEAWFRASAARMVAFTPATLAAAVQALGMLQPGKDVPGAVPGRWLQLVLQHSQQQMVDATARRPPPAAPAAGAAGEEQQQQQQQQQQGGLFSASDLSKMLWGFAELKIWPGKPWMDAWMAAISPQLMTAAPSDLADVVWALARLRCGPDDAWMTQLTAAINRQLQGFTIQGLAVVIWGYTRLGARPDRLWLLRFRAVAGSGGGGSSGSLDGSSSSSSGDVGTGQQLAEFVAAFLAQQNRQRFADSRPYGSRVQGTKGSSKATRQQQQQLRQQQQRQGRRK